MARIGIDARKLGDFGIGVHVANLVRAMAGLDGGEAAAGHEFVLFVRPGDEGFADDLPANFRAIAEPAPGYSLRELACMPWRIRRARLGLYHATHYALPPALPCPVVVTIHDLIHLLYPDLLPGRVALWYARAMFRHSVRRADRIVAVSGSTRDDILGRFRVDPAKVQVVWNGVEERYRRRLPEEEIEAAFGRLGVPRPCLLFVGNPKPHKNIDRVMRAVAMARGEAGIDAPLVCVGARGDSEAKLRQRSREVGAHEQVRVIGHVEADLLPALYQGASLFLYPSLHEGFGLPVAEAMASGVPVVTSGTSALGEIAADCAELVDPLDVEAIARAIVRCMNDRCHAERLARRGLKRSARFCWETAAASTLAIYREVLAESGGRPRTTEAARTACQVRRHRPIDRAQDRTGPTS